MVNTNKINANSAINIGYLAFLIIWPPIKLLLVRIDGKGRIVFVLTLFVLLFNLAFNPEVRKLMAKKPFVIWLVWIVYAFINMMTKGYHYSSNTPLFYLVNNLFIPYLALVLTCHESCINHSRVIKLLTFSFMFYCVLGYFFMDNIRTEDDTSITLGNSLAINASLLVFLLCAAKLVKSIKGLTFGLLVAFMLLIIISTATRKAFGVALILLAFYALGLISLRPRNIVFVAVLSIGAYVGLNYLMDKTYLGERLAATGEQAEMRENMASDNRFLQFVGDRAPHYVLGWEIFKEQPLTGIGLYNFMRVSGSNERLHTDYMVQFTENGLIGFCLFVLYYLWFIMNLIKMRKLTNDQSHVILGLGWVVAVLFLGLTAWTYDMTTVFVCSGVAASFVYSYKNENKEYA